MVIDKDEGLRADPVDEECVRMDMRLKGQANEEASHEILRIDRFLPQKLHSTSLTTFQVHEKSETTPHVPKYLLALHMSRN